MPEARSSAIVHPDTFHADPTFTAGNTPDRTISYTDVFDTPNRCAASSTDTGGSGRSQTSTVAANNDNASPDATNEAPNAANASTTAG